MSFYNMNDLSERERAHQLNKTVTIHAKIISKVSSNMNILRIVAMILIIRERTDFAG